MAQLALGQTAEGELVPVKVNKDGTLAPAPRGSGSASWQDGVTITNSTADATVRAAAGSGLRNFVTDLIVSNRHTTSIDVQLKDGSTPIGQPFVVPMGATVVLDLTTAFKTSPNAALGAALSAAVAGSVSITATGYTGS